MMAVTVTMALARGIDGGVLQLVPPHTLARSDVQPIQMPPCVNWYVPIDFCTITAHALKLS
jgi:hypothetical protein